uniref:H/ACA ribonucleoprotein complex subunit n=3 Tax=Rhodnius TaxID=13248 RepID=T1HC83_RHOPR
MNSGRKNGGRGGGGGGRFSGGGGRGFRGGGRGRGGRPSFNEGPPERVIPIGHYSHACQDDLVLKVDLNEEVPYFNAPIYTEDKNQIGKIDEIFGPIKDYFVSVKLSENIKAKNFRLKDK